MLIFLNSVLVTNYVMVRTFLGSSSSGLPQGLLHFSFFLPRVLVYFLRNMVLLKRFPCLSDDFDIARATLYIAIPMVQLWIFFGFLSSANFCSAFRPILVFCFCKQLQNLRLLLTWARSSEDPLALNPRYFNSEDPENLLVMMGKGYWQSSPKNDCSGYQVRIHDYRVLTMT